MNEWLIRQGIASPQTGIWIGLLVGGLLAVLLAGWLRAGHLREIGVRPNRCL
jgi:hypothetical protein